MTHEFLSFFDDSFGGLPKFLPLLIQLIEGLTTAFQTDKQVGEFGFTIGFHTSTPLLLRSQQSGSSA
jgi:hypothetical protein